MEERNRLSMLEKSLERRRVNKEHNSNFRAGHVAVHEGHLHKTGLRGRKGYLAVCFLLCLTIVAIVNFLLTIWILCGAQINSHGSKLFDFLRDGTLRFQVPSDFGLVHFLEGSVLGGFKGQDLQFSSTGGNITLSRQTSPGGSRVQPKVVLGGGETIFQVGDFEVINPSTGKSVFNTRGITALKFDPGTKLKSDGGVQVSKIVSPTGQGLHLHSQNSLNMHGSEGASMRANKVNLFGKNIELLRAKKIRLKSQSSSGIYLNTSLFPTLSSTDESQSRSTGTAVYKLCLCGNNGRLFRVEVTPGVESTCGQLEESFDLCD